MSLAQLLPPSAATRRAVPGSGMSSTWFGSNPKSSRLRVPLQLLAGDSSVYEEPLDTSLGISGVPSLHPSAPPFSRSDSSLNVTAQKLLADPRLLCPTLLPAAPSAAGWRRRRRRRLPRSDFGLGGAGGVRVELWTSSERRADCVSRSSPEPPAAASPAFLRRFPTPLPELRDGVSGSPSQSAKLKVPEGGIKLDARFRPLAVDRGRSGASRLVLFVPGNSSSVDIDRPFRA
mmetsp:Transcript_72513/g.193353  ORF Transcript_72513/g.193353 Transcript_72513/m.193353 type:complete len:232 (-) Transcript_72513:981-1676(-)